MYPIFYIHWKGARIWCLCPRVDKATVLLFAIIPLIYWDGFCPILMVSTQTYIPYKIGSIFTLKWIEIQFQLHLSILSKINQCLLRVHWTSWWHDSASNIILLQENWKCILLIICFAWVVEQEHKNKSRHVERGPSCYVLHCFGIDCVANCCCRIHLIEGTRVSFIYFFPKVWNLALIPVCFVRFDLFSLEYMIIYSWIVQVDDFLFETFSFFYLKIIF